MATINGYHGDKFKALHFLQIVYRKPRSSSVYKTLPKLGRYNHYKWFKILTRNPKPNYIYVVGMGFAFNAI